MVAPTTAYTVQEFTLDDARVRIEALEARVATLEAGQVPIPVMLVTPTPDVPPSTYVSVRIVIHGEANIRRYTAPAWKCDGAGPFAAIIGGEGHGRRIKIETADGLVRSSGFVSGLYDFDGVEQRCIFIGGQSMPESQNYRVILPDGSEMTVDGNVDPVTVRFDLGK